MRLARQIVAIEDQIRLHAEVDKHVHAAEGKFDMARRRLLLCKVNGAGHSPAVEPAICVDSEGLACEVTEVVGLVDALEQR